MDIYFQQVCADCRCVNEPIPKTSFVAADMLAGWRGHLTAPEDIAQVLTGGVNPARYQVSATTNARWASSRTLRMNRHNAAGIASESVSGAFPGIVAISEQEPFQFIGGLNPAAGFNLIGFPMAVYKLHAAIADDSISWDQELLLEWFGEFAVFLEYLPKNHVRTYSELRRLSDVIAGVRLLIASAKAAATKTGASVGARFGDNNEMIETPTAAPLIPGNDSRTPIVDAQSRPLAFYYILPVAYNSYYQQFTGSTGSLGHLPPQNLGDGRTTPSVPTAVLGLSPQPGVDPSPPAQPIQQRSFSVVMGGMPVFAPCGYRRTFVAQGPNGTTGPGLVTLHQSSGTIVVDPPDTPGYIKIDPLPCPP